MSHQVVFAPEAVDQLEALFLYISEQASPAMAQRYTAAVVDACERLADFPQRGVPRSDIRPGLRLTHHRGRTVIAYTIDEGAATVSIVGVFYGGQDHAAALEEGAGGP